MIVFYAKTCEGCSGNTALNKMKQACAERSEDFEERLTVLWKRYEEEANAISEALGVKLPFFYNTKTEQALEGNSLTLLDDIEKFVKG